VQFASRALKINSVDVNYPNISADGNWVVYVASSLEGIQNIYVQHVVGGEARRLTNDTTWMSKSSPCFSPDGGSIAYDCWHYDTIDPGQNIYLIPTQGGYSRKLIDSAQLPVWSPTAA